MKAQQTRPSIFSINLLIYFICLFLLSSCTFFELPERKARDVGTKSIGDLSWLINATGNNIYDISTLKAALCNGLANVVRLGDEDDCSRLTQIGKKEDRKKGQKISEFLHVSDAQIRDESLYESSLLDLLQMYSLDNLVRVTIRRPLVEKFDAFTLAAFLAGYGKAVAEKPGNQFVVHTGDLLDISVVTELMDGLHVFKTLSQSFNTNGSSMKIYSVAGNHDGLVFGNIPDGDADGRGLDINKSEFIFAHLLEDKDRGFGFGKNEFLVQFYKYLREVQYKLNEQSRKNNQATRLSDSQQKDLPAAQKTIRSVCRTHISPRVKFTNNRQLKGDNFWWDRNKSWWQKNEERRAKQDTLYEKSWWELENNWWENKPKTSGIKNWWEKENDWWQDAQILCTLSVHVLKRLNALQQPGKTHQLSMPIAYRKAIDFPGKFTQMPIKLGYYSWCDYIDETHNQPNQSCQEKIENPPSFTGVRYLVLDTRNNDSHNGTMDWVQLGWVYNELRAALANHEVVVVFSHDAPDKIPFVPFDFQEEYQTLVDLLHTFPNVAAVFYGHEHHNDNKPPTRFKRFASAQTGSLADFPQVGREVKMYIQHCKDVAQDNKDPLSETRCDKLDDTGKENHPHRLTIESRFVRPRGDFEQTNGFLVESILRASRRDSEKEDQTKAWRKLLFPFIPKHESLSAHKWPKENHSPHADPYDQEESPYGIVDQDDNPVVMFPVIHFFEDSERLSPPTFFKEDLLCQINNTRLVFGLEAIRDAEKYCPYDPQDGDILLPYP